MKTVLFCFDINTIVARLIVNQSTDCTVSSCKVSLLTEMKLSLLHFKILLHSLYSEINANKCFHSLTLY